MLEDLNLIKLTALSVGVRLPNDSFFDDGNTFIKHIKKFGIYETDSEDLLHEPVTLFDCEVLGCNKKFDSVFQFEQHYNSNHRYSCGTCKKSLTSPHLLDLHICESHDSYFAVQSEKKSMFRCYLEECSGIFLSPTLRKEHCIEEHNFPSNFFNNMCVPTLAKQTRNGKSKKEPKINANKKKDGKKMEVDIAEPIKDKGGENPKKSTKCLKKSLSKDDVNDSLESMEITEKTTKNQNKSLGPGNRQNRRRLFFSFEKDMADSLPKLN